MHRGVYAGSDQIIRGGPCCCTPLISVYVQQMSHIYRALQQRKYSPKDVPTAKRDRHTQGFRSHANERQKRGYAALSPNIRVDCREHFIEPTDNLRSEQDVHVVAGNASSKSKLMSTIAALSYLTLVPSNFRPENTSYNVRHYTSYSL